jgi:hypothetical protein
VCSEVRLNSNGNKVVVRSSLHVELTVDLIMEFLPRALVFEDDRM